MTKSFYELKNRTGVTRTHQGYFETHQMAARWAQAHSNGQTDGRWKVTGIGRHEAETTRGRYTIQRLEFSTLD
jgi:hypothetical protein